MDLELDSRISAAWHSFHANAATLCCMEVPLDKRLMLLRSVVEPSLFWCAGTWKMSVDHCKKIRGTQRQMLRKMIKMKRRDGESDEDFFRRTERIITDALVNRGVKTWDITARSAYFKWAGSVSRMGNSRVTAQVLHFMNIDKIYEYAKLHRGCQGHGRRLHIWRWESEVFEFAHDWEVLASNVTDWLSQYLDRFEFSKVVANNLRTRGLKRPYE
jgi:hypothetical protein